MASTAPVVRKFPCSLCKGYPMMTPIYQCCEGHAICTSCEDIRMNCPECEVPLQKLPKIRCLALEHLQPPLIKCAMRQCTKLFPTAELMQSHRLFDCDFLDVPMCKWTGVDSSCRQCFAPNETFRAARHLFNSHKSNVFDYDRYKRTEVGVSSSSTIQDFINPVEGVPKFIYGKVNHRLVLIKIEVKHGRRKLTPFILASSKQAVRFKLDIKIELRIKLPKSAKPESVAPNGEPHVITTHSGPLIQIAETGDLILDLYAIDGSSAQMKAEIVDLNVDQILNAPE